jgi:hypothetical protein
MSKNNTMMGKIYLLGIIVVASSATMAQSPITLNNSNMPGNGDTLRYTNASPNSVGNYTQTGTNFNWNFSTLASTTEGVRRFKTAWQTPYVLYFLSLSEYGEKIADTLLGVGSLNITNYYNYYKQQSSPAAYTADGVGMTISGVPVPSYYSDKDELYRFPMTYPQYDSTTFKFSTPSLSLIPVVYSKSGYRVTKVDGWGNVTTPYGTANCLRLVTTQYGIDTIKTTIGSITVPVGYPNYQRSYQWISSASKIPFLEINGTLIGNIFTITQVRYRGYNQLSTTRVKNLIADAGQIQLYPNPVSNKLILKNIQNTVLAEVYDLTSKLIKKITIELEDSNTMADVSDLSPGVYLLKLTGLQGVSYHKFVKEISK